MLTATVELCGNSLLCVSHASPSRGSTIADSAAPILAAAILVCLVLVTVRFSHAESIQRIFAENGWQTIPPIFGPQAGRFLAVLSIVLWARPVCAGLPEHRTIGTAKWGPFKPTG